MISSKLRMRRFENCTHDPEMIKAILDLTRTVYIGCYDEEYPYVVPLCFGYEIKDDKLLVYVHCAREGHKVDLWNKNPHVSLTFAEMYNHPDKLYRGCMHDFRSVMALGTISRIDRKTQSHQNGTAVQSMLKHSDRKPNQFSVSHYMWMDAYVITCDMENVCGKFENPIEDPAEVPFPDVYSIPDNNEPYDNEYFYHKKQYQSRQNVWPMELPGADPLPEESVIPLSANVIDLTARWHIRPDAADQDVDIDLSALILNQEGKVPRRYDMVFYNQNGDRSDTVQHMGDDILADKRGSETLRIYPERAPEYLDSIIINLSRYKAEENSAGLDAADAISLTVTDPETGSVLAEYSIDMENIPEGCPAAAVASLTRSGSGWCLKNNVKVLPSWRILEQSAQYGLIKWKE